METTAIKENWVIEKEFSNNSDRSDSFEKKIVLNSIFSSIDLSKFSKVENSTEQDKNQFKDASFIIPNFIGRNISRPNSFIVNSQNWIGYVNNIFSDYFTATIHDKEDDTTYEIAKFELKDISKSDIELFREGSIFYWSVCYANVNGQISKLSFLRFKRNIVMSAKEVDTLLDEASDLNDKIKWS